MVNFAQFISLGMFMTYLFMLPICFAQNISTQDAKNIVTVIVNGLGKDIPDAAQNAAQNALTDVAGSFMDINTILEKRAIIQDGIRRESKQIKTDIKEYSQGTIKHFEIVDSSIQNGLMKVTAKISVRLEDFRAYIRKLAEGETSIDSGLFVKMQSINKQNKNKIGLLLDNILKPITGGMVVKFNVESPELLSDIPYQGNTYIGSDTHNSYLRDRNLDVMKKKFGINSIISFRVTALLTDDFQKNMLDTISSISSDRKITSSLFPGSYYFLTNFPNFNDTEDLAFFIVENKKTDKEKVISSAYLINGVRREVFNSYSWGNHDKHGPAVPLLRLEVVLADSDGKSLQREIVEPNNHSVEKIFVDSNDAKLGGFPSPWEFLGKSGNGIVTVKNRTFTVYMSVDADSLKSAKKIIVRLID